MSKGEELNAAFRQLPHEGNLRVLPLGRQSLRVPAGGKGTKHAQTPLLSSLSSMRACESLSYVRPSLGEAGSESVLFILT